MVAELSQRAASAWASLAAVAKELDPPTGRFRPSPQLKCSSRCEPRQLETIR